MNNKKDSHYYCKIADVKVKILISDKISKRLAKELGAKRTEGTEDADITLRLNDKNIFDQYTPKIYSAKGSMNFNENQFYVDYIDEFKYILEHWSEKSSLLVIDTNKNNWRKTIKSFAIGKTKLVADAILSYSLFWYITHLKLLQKNCSFLHAGIIERGGKAIVFTGTGGCGKTSTLFKALEDIEVKYLAEDFGIIDNKGIAHFSPKPITVYASDLNYGDNLLNRYLKNKPFREEIVWFLKRKFLGLNPMVKISPKSIFNNKRISICAPVGYVIYMVRGEFQEIKIEDIGIDDLARRMTWSSSRELKVLSELSSLMNANAPSDYNLPNFEKLCEKAEKIYRAGIQKTERKIMYIPLKAKPSEILDFLTMSGIF